MNLEIATLLLLALGFVPWHVSRNQVMGRKELSQVQVLWKCQAIFWQLTIRRQHHGHSTWKLTVPLIERLSTAIWTMIKNLILK